MMSLPVASADQICALSPMSYVAAGGIRRMKELGEYQQAFAADGGRLCTICMKEVSAANPAAGAVLDGMVDLFCRHAAFRSKLFGDSVG